MAGRRTNSFYMLAGQIFGKAGFFLSLMIYSRILADSVFGELLLAVSFGLLIIFLSDMGVTMLVTRRLSTDGSAHSVLSAALALRAVLSAASMALVVTAVLLAGYSRQQVILVTLVCFGSVLSGFSDTAFALFRAREKMVYEGAARTLRGILGVLLAIYAWHSGRGAVFAGWTYVLREVPALLSSGAAILLRTRYVPSFRRRDLREMGPLFTAALPLGITGLLIAAGQRIDGIFIKEYLGDSAIAAYQQCLKVFETLILLVTPTLVPGALFPALCRAVKTGWGEARMRLAWMTELFLVIALLLITVFWSGEQQILRFLWGEDFLRGVTPLELRNTYRIVLLTLPVAYLFHLYIATFIAAEKQKRTLPIIAVPLAVEVVLFMVLIPLLGITGAAVTHFFFLLAATALMIIDLNRHYGPTGFLRGALRPLLSFIPALAVLQLAPLEDALKGVTALAAFILPWMLAGGLSIVPKKRTV